MNYSTKLEEIKEKARTDLFYFVRDILGYKEVAEQPHRELCDFLLTWNKRKKLIMLPRGAFKSTIITVAHTLHALCYDPNLRIMLCTENYQNATMYLKEVKDQIENNKTLKLVYGDLKGRDKGEWTKTEFSVATKTRTGGKEPSMQVTSVGNTKVGIHANLLILDDVVSNINTNTKEQIQKVIDYYKYLLSIADPMSKIIVVGTSYTFGDLYDYIQEVEKENFDMLIRGCTKDRTYDFSEENLYFPSRLTRAFLEETRQSQGSWIFSNQYMNMAIDSGSQVFKQEWLRYYETPPNDLNYFITVDPAATTGRESDYTAILVIGVDWRDNIYVIENHQLKVTVEHWMDLIFRKCQEYGIGIYGGAVSMETNALQQGFKHAFDLEADKRKFYPPLHESKPNSGSRSKEARISALQPFFERGKIFLKKEQYSLIDQILRFPKSKNDDQLDALKDVLAIRYTPDPPKEASLLDKATHLTDNEREQWLTLKLYDKPRKVRMTKRI